MIRPPFVLLFAFTLIPSALAETHEEKFHRMDTNHDGVVSYEEQKAATDADFRAIAKSGEDTITVEEYADWLAKKMPKAPANALLSLARCFFKTIDPNSSGKLTHAQWRAYDDRLFNWLANGKTTMTLEDSRRVPPPDIIPRVVCH